ncbi:MAG: hypothetical protein SCH98_05610 [Deferrisomatales bacterium]|nr:hypothetical protein [Deferrisomatales bacterium]
MPRARTGRCDIRTNLKILAAVLTLASWLYAGLAAAGAERRLSLMADQAGKGATAEAVITDKGGDQTEVVITAIGLKPGAVHTVWLVNMKAKMDMAGLGTGDYSFRTDEKGSARYAATISPSELKKCQLQEIAYHPSGDPKNMHEMMGNIVLKAMLGE